MFGEPTGLTLKSWTTSHTAFDVGFTYSFSNFVELLGDYLWHFPITRSEFIPYLGLGGEVFFDISDSERDGRFVRGGTRSNAGFGVRIPLGLEFLPHRVPVGVFGEVVPGLALAPGVFGFVEGDVGLRFYL
jgi:hypothetical protein